MIYQIHFTLALELVALCLATLVLLWSAQHVSRFKMIGMLSGLFGIIAAVVLFISTAYFMYFPPTPAATAETPKTKLQMQLPTSGPTKGGYVTPIKPSADSNSQGNKGTGVELPTMTVPKKSEN